MSARTDNSEHADRDDLIPAAPSEGVLRVFSWYTRRLFRRNFHAVRAITESIRAIDSLNHTDAPVIVLMNHASWWDPLAGVLLSDRFLPSRSSRAPMDRAQLERFRFMRKLGLFGIDPESHRTPRLMRDYVLRFFAESTRPTLWITPQGRFTDVRTPIILRPGAASIAAAQRSVIVLCLNIEYTFWQEQRPEMFLRFARCETDQPTTTGWHRAMTRAMRQNAEALAECVIARDPEPFTSLIGGEKATINPIYDLWLRLRGRSGGIEAQRDRGANRRQPTTHPKHIS